MSDTTHAEAVPSYVRLANDVALHFAHRPVDEASAAVAEHIRLFWDPRMRRSLLEFVDGGAAGLDPLAAGAAALMRDPA